MSWSIGFTSSYRYPIATYRCSACKTETIFSVGSGTVPDPKCCKMREPYPNTAEFMRHLSLQPNSNSYGDAHNVDDRIAAFTSRGNVSQTKLSSLLGKKIKALFGF
jgi:hypothetical protein